MTVFTTRVSKNPVPLSRNLLLSRASCFRDASLHPEPINDDILMGSGGTGGRGSVEQEEGGVGGKSNKAGERRKEGEKRQKKGQTCQFGWLIRKRLGVWASERRTNV